MLRNHLPILAALAVTAVGFCADASAQVRRPMAQQTAPQWYLGGGIGKAEIDGTLSSNNLAVAGATSSTFKPDSSSTAVRAFIGLKATPYIAVEGGFWHLGKFGGRRDVSAPSSGTVDSHFTMNGIGVNAMAIWPVADSFSVFAKLGTVLMRAEERTTNSFANTETKHTTNKWALHYGLGAQYDINSRLGLRADWDILKRATNSAALSLDGNSFDFKVVTGSVVVKF